MTSLGIRPQPLRRLQGPASEARLRKAQVRFARIHRRIARRRAYQPWKLAILSAATFTGIIITGVLLGR